MNTEEREDQIPRVTIEDEYAQRWYDTGFKFAINYLYAWITDESDREKYQELVRRFVGEEDNNGDPVLDESYFENLRFYQGDNSYSAHQCPDPNDPRICIPCTAQAVQEVPRPNLKKA